MTIRPSSLEELQETFAKWLPSERRSEPHAQRKHGRLILRPAAFAKVHFRLNEGGVALSRGSRRLFVALDHFAVETKGQGSQMCFVFTPRKFVSSRPLREGLRVIEETEYPIFVARALHALKELEQLLPKERIEEAATAPSDCLVLLKALTASPVATQASNADPLAAARLRAIHNQQMLLQGSGGTFSAQQTAELLGISRQAVDKRRRQGRLIGLTQGRRGYAYPAWQFEKGRALPHLEEVLRALRGHDPWMQMAFFLNGNDRLAGKSPLHALGRGQIDAVLLAADSFGEHGAA